VLRVNGICDGNQIHVLVYLLGAQGRLQVPSACL
jgi:hypothetical protein